MTSYCECGCGEAVTIYRNQPRRFLPGHNPPSAEFITAGAEAQRGRGKAWTWLVRALSKPTRDCVLWPWARRHNGYGELRGNGRKQRAHVAAWELRHGVALPSSLELHHICEQPLCVNPDHLAAVTHRGHSAIHRPSNRRPQG